MTPQTPNGVADPSTNSDLATNVTQQRIKPPALHGGTGSDVNPSPSQASPHASVSENKVIVDYGEGYNTRSGSSADLQMVNGNQPLGARSVKSSSHAPSFPEKIDGITRAELITYPESTPSSLKTGPALSMRVDSVREPLSAGSHRTVGSMSDPYPNSYSYGTHPPSVQQPRLAVEERTVERVQSALVALNVVCNELSVFSSRYGASLEQTLRTNGPRAPAPLPAAGDSINFSKVIQDLDYCGQVLKFLSFGAGNAPPPFNRPSNTPQVYGDDPTGAPVIGPGPPAAATPQSYAVQQFASPSYVNNLAPSPSGGYPYPAMGWPIQETEPPQSKVYVQYQHPHSYPLHLPKPPAQQPHSVPHAYSPVPPPFQPVTPYASVHSGYAHITQAPHSSVRGRPPAPTPVGGSTLWPPNAPPMHAAPEGLSYQPRPAPYYNSVPLNPAVPSASANSAPLHGVSNSPVSQHGSSCYAPTTYSSQEDSFRRIRKQDNDSRQCFQCGTVKTPEWRRGPDGSRTLCNACGLQFAKQEKKRKKLQDNGEGVPVTTISSTSPGKSNQSVVVTEVKHDASS